MTSSLHTVETRLSYRPDIDGLRALAIIVVVGFHAFPQILSGGFIGVDVFFVISGFLITQVLEQQRKQPNFSPGEFYAGRIRRLFPSLLVVLTVCFIFGWIAFLSDEYKQLGKQILASTLFVSNFIYWAEAGYFDYAAYTKPLLHLWSLGIEGQFYILWPVVFLVALRFGISIAKICVVLIAASLVLNIWVAPESGSHAFYSPATRMWELLCGCLIAIFHRLRLERPGAASVVGNFSVMNQSAMSVAGVALVLSSAIFFDQDLTFPGYWAICPVLGTTLIILAGTDSWFNRQVLSSRILVRIGLISFPLYLWHWPILSFAKIVSGIQPPAEVQIGLIALAVGLSIITYRWVERPLRFGSNLRMKTRWLIAGMCILAVCSVITFFQDGFPRRYKNQLVQAQLADLKFDLPDSEVWYCADTSQDGPRCHASGPDPSVVVIGDSHALTIYSGLIDRFKSKGQEIALYGASDGCPPLLDVEIQDLGGDARNCLVKGSQAIRRIISDLSIQHVIITSRGPMYTTAEGFGEIELEQFGTWALNFKGELRGARTNQEVFSLGLAKTLDALLSSGKTVTFLHDVPELGFDIRRCFAFRPFAMFADEKQPCAVSKADFESRTNAYRLLIDPVLAQRSAIKVIDLAEALCDQHWCYGAKDGALFYIDDDHLSHRGASYVVKRLWDKF